MKILHSKNMVLVSNHVVIITALVLVLVFL